MMTEKTVTAKVTPLDSLSALSPHEIRKLQDASHGGLYRLFRQCALAVLNSGSELDSTKLMLDRNSDFDISISQRHRSVQLELINAPATAFVGKELITSIREQLFSAVRDLLYVGNELDSCCPNSSETETITNIVFYILRHANAIKPHIKPNLVVCWGGHSISRDEYDYSKKVGYELGLRGLNICTGCGPGAMKGPMKGATISHVKQRIQDARYIGITEPGIIAAESPNQIVNELVILPNIEKRLEAFVRLGHGIIVFPGGAGTMEEILYIIGILLHEKNTRIPFPLILTGPKGSEVYFEAVDDFIRKVLGEEATAKYKIIINDPHGVAQAMQEGIRQVTRYRKAASESFHYNWQLHIPIVFQHEFEPNHENMADLNLTKNQAMFELAANIRRALSGIVAGNIKESGVYIVEKYGVFVLHGERIIAQPLNSLLESFIQQRRMKVEYKKYKPCYRFEFLD